MTRSARATGYAQVLERRKVSDNSVEVTYTIGDDVVTRATDTGTSSSRHLIYDGHGNTRLLTDSSGGITDRYDYSAYGKRIGGNPTITSPAATDLLYCGEHFDPGLQHTYLRARWYDPANGRFNRVDPFEGSQQEPQSLHKYLGSLNNPLTPKSRAECSGKSAASERQGEVVQRPHLYTHGNPVGGVDPTGMFGYVSIGIASAIRAELSVSYLAALRGTQYTLRGLSLGLSVNQTIGNMFWDWLFEPLDDIVEIIGAGINIAHELFNNIVETSDGLEVQKAGVPTVGLGTALVAWYYRTRTPSGLRQGHHLNQYAAFKRAFDRAGYGRNDGTVAYLDGQYRGTEHVVLHNELEARLWSRYRGTTERPTVAEYNRTMFDIIRELRGENSARWVVVYAAGEQRQLGLRSRDLVPDIPSLGGRR